MKILRRLYTYLHAYKAWAGVAFLSMLVFALSQTVLAAMVQPLFDEVLAPRGVEEPVQPDGKISAVLREFPVIGTLKAHWDGWWNQDQENKGSRVLTVILIVFVIRACTSFFSEYAFQKVGLSTVRDLRNQLYERMIHQSHRFFSERPTGEVVSRVVSDAQERMAEIATILEETVRGVRIVKAFTMEPFEIGRFREATRKHLRWALSAQRTQALTSPVMELLAGVCMVLLFGYAERRIDAGELTTGNFVSFLTALALMYAPIKKLNKVNLSLNTALAASERVFAMLDIENDVKEKENAVVLQGVGRGIRYDDVTFGYGNEPVLRNINLDVAPGEIVALVGGSGSGKTSLVNLLPRFYDVLDGRITVDGIDLRDATLHSLRTLMGFVTQEVVLFNDTVRNNIAYGRTDVDEAQVIAAAQAANAHEFITNLPHGYDTSIGESGVLLSGGQRQRLAIARALFKDPPILVLDEATSALDTESERLVQQALNNLMQGRTTLVIAHRLSTIRSAHKIVVLDKGRIVEVGTHEELLGRRGVYRKLYDLQFVDDEVTEVTTTT
jgi:subfamily B ATP-binding cassette protein MsbA